MAKRVYLDSGVILAYLRQEAGRADVIEAALFQSMSSAPDYEFFTSSLSLTEVAYVEGLDGGIDPDFSVIDDFWGSVPITMLEVNEVNAIQGRAPLRERAIANVNPQQAKPKKRAADAIHLATALWLELDEFWTYDTRDLLKYPEHAIIICEPHTRQMMLPFSQIDDSPRSDS